MTSNTCPICGKHWSIRETETRGVEMTKRSTCPDGHQWSNTFVGHLEGSHWVYQPKLPQIQL